MIATIVADEWDERVDTITRGFLGLTVACARCHDHKFDPISTADYYALAGVMASTQLIERPIVAAEPNAEDLIIRVRNEVEDHQSRLREAREKKARAIKDKKDPAEFEQQIAEHDAKIKELKASKLFTDPHRARCSRRGALGRRQQPRVDLAQLPAWNLAQPADLHPGECVERRANRPSKVSGGALGGGTETLRRRKWSKRAGRGDRGARPRR